MTRWTFFRVKLVSECDFEMSWSLCLLDPWTFGPLPSSSTPSYFLLPPHISSSYSPPLVSFGMGGGGVEFWHWRLRWTIGDWHLTFRLMFKSYGWWWWVYLDYSVSSGPFWVMRLRLEMDQDPSLTIDVSIWSLTVWRQLHVCQVPRSPICQFYQPQLF